MDLFSFIATGVVPYTLFSSSVRRVAEAINGNKSLLYYPQVRPIDLVMARSALEAATFSAVFLLLLGGRALYVQELQVESPLHVIAGMATASLLGTGFGMIFCALGQIAPSVDRARGPLMRPRFWISGIFFTAEMVPEAMRDVALANPVLHATELVRAGWFHDYSARHVELGYVAAWLLALLFAGLLLERAVRRKIEMA
jgi:capsular polysaccharide transport system permease protein